MCFCRYDIDSMYAKYKDLHPDEASCLSLQEWVSSSESKALSHDGQTLLQLYKLNLLQPLKI